jgi:hypothetical protein
VHGHHGWPAFIDNLAKRTLMLVASQGIVQDPPAPAAPAPTPKPELVIDDIFDERDFEYDEEYDDVYEGSE